jgi:methyltransferase-like protein
VSLHRELDPESVRAFRIASAARCTSSRPDLRPGRPEEFSAPAGNSLGTDHALSKAALVCLEEAWPRSLTFDALEAAARARLSEGGLVLQPAAAYARDTRELADTLFQAFTADVTELHRYEPPLATEPGARPLASAWARRQAALGNQVTNRRHEVLPVDDLTRHLLCLLDGSRDHPALLDACLGRVAELGLVVQQHGQPVTDPAALHAVLAKALEVKLNGLARSALLVG